MDPRLQNSLKSQVEGVLSPGSMPEADRAKIWKDKADAAKLLLQNGTAPALELISDNSIFQAKLKEKAQSLANDDKILNYNSNNQEARIENLKLHNSLHSFRQEKNVAALDITKEIAASGDKFQEKIDALKTLSEPHKAKIEEFKNATDASKQKEIIDSFKTDAEKLAFAKALAASEIISLIDAAPKPITAESVKVLLGEVNQTIQTDIAAVEADYLRITVRISLLNESLEAQNNRSKPEDEHLHDAKDEEHVEPNSATSKTATEKPAIKDLAKGTIENPIIDSAMTFEEATKDAKASSSLIQDMRLIDVKYYGLGDGKVHQGQLVVHKDRAEELKQIFKEILDNKCGLRKMIPIVRYHWHDQNSIDDGNSSAFNPRKARGPGIDPTKDSEHTFTAIDLNTTENPFVGKDKNGNPKPANRVYDPKVPGTFTKDSMVVKIFQKYGWTWAGDGSWPSGWDYQHFEKPLPKAIVEQYKKK